MATENSLHISHSYKKMQSGPGRFVSSNYTFSSGTLLQFHIYHYVMLAANLALASIALHLTSGSDDVTGSCMNEHKDLIIVILR
jgi:hypothetical protein